MLIATQSGSPPQRREQPALPETPINIYHKPRPEVREENPSQSPRWREWRHSLWRHSLWRHSLWRHLDRQLHAAAASVLFSRPKIIKRELA